MWCCWFCSSDFHEKCRMIAAALSLLLKSLGLNGGGGTCARRAHSLSFSPIHFQQPVMLRSPFRDQTNWLMTLMSAAVSGQSRSKKVPRKTFPPPSPLPPPLHLLLSKPSKCPSAERFSRVKDEREGASSA